MGAVVHVKISSTTMKWPGTGIDTVLPFVYSCKTTAIRQTVGALNGALVNSGERDSFLLSRNLKRYLDSEKTMMRMIPAGIASIGNRVFQQI